MRFPQFSDKIAYFDDLDRIQTDRRLIQNYDLGISDQGLRNADPLIEPLGQCGNISTSFSSVLLFPSVRAQVSPYAEKRCQSIRICIQ